MYIFPTGGVNWPTSLPVGIGVTQNNEPLLAQHAIGGPATDNVFYMDRLSNLSKPHSLFEAWRVFTLQNSNAY
jgi:hypothetical protein